MLRFGRVGVDEILFPAGRIEEGFPTGFKKRKRNNWGVPEAAELEGGNRLCRSLFLMSERMHELLK